jgi:hypothetical protein
MQIQAGSIGVAMQEEEEQEAKWTNNIQIRMRGK